MAEAGLRLRVACAGIEITPDPRTPESSRRSPAASRRSCQAALASDAKVHAAEILVMHNIGGRR